MVEGIKSRWQYLVKFESKSSTVNLINSISLIIVFEIWSLREINKKLWKFDNRY